MNVFPENTLIIASHNKGKVREISELLTPFSVKVESAGDRDLPEPEETEKTFEGNALLKARSAFEHSGCAALADDSGLVVPDLNGDPGIYSARWAGPEKDFVKAGELIRTKLAERYPDASQPHKAYFVCSLALMSEGVEEVFTGKVHGHLCFPPAGDKGFGYDPIFVPEGHDISFAQMEPAQKHAMSHRADAFAQLISWIEGKRAA